MSPEDVRPICIFCHQRFTKEGLGLDAVVPCPDPRTSWGHVEFWNSTREQREARFGPVPAKPTPAEHAAIVRELKGQPPPIEVKELPPQQSLF